MEDRVIPNTAAIRTPYLASIIDGFTRQDAVAQPLRDKATIPLSYPLLMCAIRATNEVFKHRAEYAHAVRAAFALGYCMSLRPGEYLMMYDERGANEQLCAGNATFWWGDDTHFTATEPWNFPTRKATRMTMSIDFVKNDPLGKGLPRAVSRAPLTSAICCLGVIETFVRRRSLLASEPFLMTSEGQVHWQDIRNILGRVARMSGVDETKLTPHSIRAGAVNQLDARKHSVDQMRRQGGWTSTGGMQAYLRTNFRNADDVADTLHDEHAIPLSHTKHMFAGGRVGLIGDRPPAT